MRRGLKNRVLLTLLWLLGTTLAFVVDGAFQGPALPFVLGVETLGWSPVAGNPLRPDFLPSWASWVGFALAGLLLPGAVVVSDRSEGRARELAPIVICSATGLGGLGLALVYVRGWDGAPTVAGLSFLGLLCCPWIERRRRSQWWVPYGIALGQVIYFGLFDPAHSIARAHFPEDVGWWITVAAAGVALTRQLWTHDLRFTAVANSGFWSCAIWSLVANSLEVSKYSVGVKGIVWRASGWQQYLGPDPGSCKSTWDVLWLSLPSMSLLVAALWILPRALHWLTDVTMAGAARLAPEVEPGPECAGRLLVRPSALPNAAGEDSRRGSACFSLERRSWREEGLP